MMRWGFAILLMVCGVSFVQAQSLDIARLKMLFDGATMAEVKQSLGPSADEYAALRTKPVWIHYTSVFTGKTISTDLAAHRRWRYGIATDGRLHAHCQQGHLCLAVYFYAGKVYSVGMLPQGD